MSDIGKEALNHALVTNLLTEGDMDALRANATEGLTFVVKPDAVFLWLTDELVRKVGGYTLQVDRRS